MIVAAAFLAASIALMAGIHVLMTRIPTDRYRSADEYGRLAWMTIAIAALDVVLAAGCFALIETDLYGLVFAFMAVAHIYLGAGWLNSARMLRRVPELTGPTEEPSALALEANGMPGPSRTVVVGTEERIVWANGGESHELRLADVESHEASGGKLVVAGAGRELRVRPVPRPELKKFERLLARA